MIRHVHIISVDIIEEADSMNLLAHVYEDRGKQFVSTAWVPHRLKGKPYRWAYPGTKRRDNGSSS